MSKPVSVNDVLASIHADGVNKFSKKKFEELMLAMANDVNFTEDVVKVKNMQLSEVKTIMVSKEFRKWCKKLLESVGVDKAESERVMSDEFIFSNMNGLYEFFASAIYEFMNAGYKFDLLPKEDFKGSIYLADAEEKKSVSEVRSPRDGSYLGKFETTEKKHKKLKAASPCPSYLRSRVKIN